MNFIINMAWREMRSSWHRLLLFFLCIAIGVGSIVCLRSLIQSVNAAIKREARLLIASDVAVSADGPWKAESMAVLERYFNSPLVLDHTETLELGMLVRSAADPQALPGIQSAGLTSFLPLASPELAAPIQVEGRPPIVLGKEPYVFFNHVSRDYFRTMGMQVRAGRPFSAQDDPEAQLAAIINETVARR